MHRFATGVAVVIAMGVIGVAPAEAARYKGEIKGEPGASLTLQVKKSEGDRYVTRIAFKDIPVECNDGNHTTSGDGRAGANRDGLLIQQREFSGPWDFGKIAGKARGGGKIAGTVSIKTQQGAPLGTCKSGDLEYVVERV